MNQMEGRGHASSPFDLCSLNDIDNWVRQCTEAYGPSAGLVHSAGIHTCTVTILKRETARKYDANQRERGRDAVEGHAPKRLLPATPEYCLLPLRFGPGGIQRFAGLFASKSALDRPLPQPCHRTRSFGNARKLRCSWLGAIRHGKQNGGVDFVGPNGGCRRKASTGNRRAARCCSGNRIPSRR